MHKVSFNCSLDSNCLGLIVGIIYCLTRFLQNDFPKNALAGMNCIVLDLFCICTNDRNRAPLIHAIWGLQIYSTAFYLKQVSCVGCDFGKYRFQIQCDRDLAPDLCKDSGLLSAALGLLE